MLQMLLLLVCVLGMKILQDKRKLNLLERKATYWHTRAQTDELTGLMNKAGLVANWARVINRVPEDHHLAVFMCDANGFKAINDKHGHPAGDEVLGQLAVVLRQTLRMADLLVRWGGDEFLAILTVAPEADLPAIAQRVQEKVRANHTDQIVSLSVGVVRIPDPKNTSLYAATESADRALYHAKTKKGTDELPISVS